MKIDITNIGTARSKLLPGVVLLAFLFFSCSSEVDNEELLKTENLSVGIHSQGVQPLQNSTVIKVGFSETQKISPYIYGVNNDWRQISNERYSIFSEFLEGINYSLLRFPGGWESEYYDWSENTTPDWNKAPTSPGASIETVKATNPEALNIVVPTVDAMNLQQWSPEWYASIQNLKQEAEEAIKITGSENIRTIEIGNEWWLQWGGGVSRYDKVRKYAHIARRIAAHIRATFPAADFNILVNGDYTVPEEFNVIRYIFEASGELDLINGVALHTYAGYDSETHNLSELSQKIASCTENLGKPYISLSEWAPARAYNNNQIYAQGANLLVEQIFEHAKAGANEAAFWPPTNNGIPGLGLFNYGLTKVFPTGQLFGDMAKDFRGRLLTVVDGTVRAAAAQNESGDVVVYITGKATPATTVNLELEDHKIDRVISSELWEPGDPDQTDAAIPMKKINNPPFIKKGKGIRLNINENSSYSIYKIKFSIKE